MSEWFNYDDAKEGDYGPKIGLYDLVKPGTYFIGVTESALADAEIGKKIDPSQVTILKKLSLGGGLPPVDHKLKYSYYGYVRVTDSTLKKYAEEHFSDTTDVVWADALFLDDPEFGPREEL